jgi:hypothetical protein
MLVAVPATQQMQHYQATKVIGASHIITCNRAGE